MKKFVTESQHEHVMNMLIKRIERVESSQRDVRNNQWEHRKELHELMVSFLVEAGILVEDKEPSARTIFWDNKRYKVKKVK